MKIGKEHFRERRQRVLQSMGPRSAMLLFGARHVLRNGDAEFPFRQDSIFGTHRLARPRRGVATPTGC